MKIKILTVIFLEVTLQVGGISVEARFFITALQHYRITALPHYRITALQHYSITALPHYSITAFILLIRGGLSLRFSHYCITEFPDFS